MLQGIKLLGDYIGMADSEVQRQALIQTVEFYRRVVKDSSKASLGLL